MGLCLVFNLAVGLYPQPLLELTRQSLMVLAPGG